MDGGKGKVEKGGGITFLTFFYNVSSKVLQNFISKLTRRPLLRQAAGG